MTKQEIQKKSAEKQEKILDCLRRVGIPMTGQAGNENPWNAL